MNTKKTSFPKSTASQRKLLFETWEATGRVTQASAVAHLSRMTFYLWKPRFEAEGYAGLETPRSHRPKRQAQQKPVAIANEVIGMRQAHPDWGKKRIAQVMAQAHAWTPVISPNTVKRILSAAGLWSSAPGKKKTAVPSLPNTPTSPVKP